MRVAAAIIFLLVVSQSLCTPDSSFESEDELKLINFLGSTRRGKNFGSLEDTYDAVSSLKLLNKDPEEKKEVCKFAEEGLKSDSVEDIFYAVAIREKLKCGEKVSDKVVGILTTALESENLLQLVYSVEAISILKENSHITLDSSEILPALNAIKDLLKDDDGTWKLDQSNEDGSAYYTGLALSALSKLATYADAKEFKDAIEAANTLLDNTYKNEVSTFFSHSDSTVSALTTTATLVKGIADLTAATKGEVKSIDGKLSSLANFILSQKNVANLKDAHSLLVGLNALNSFKVKSIVISLVNNQIFSTKEKSKDNDIKVKVTDIWGKHVKYNKFFLIQVYNAAKPKTPLFSNQELSANDKNLFSVDLLSARPDPGLYILEFRIIPEGDSKKFTTALRNVRVVAQVELTDGELSVSDSGDKTFNSKGYPFTTDKQVSQKLSLSAKQHLFINFKLKNSASGKNVAVRQTFLKFTHVETGRVTYFLVTQSGANYEAHVDLHKDSRKFGNLHGIYKIELLVGDSYIEKSYKLSLAEAEIKFSGEPEAVKPDFYKPLPVIEHAFRPPSTLAPGWMSNIFSIVVLAPLALLVIGVFTVGANFSNYPTSGLTPIFALLFLGSLGLMLAVIVLYWLNLKLFTAITYLGILSIPTVVFGSFVLSAQSEKRK